MSWGSCASGSNNIHFGFPPLMNDGRNFSSWQPGGALNENIRKNENITSNWQYRRYLMNNADKIIMANQVEACNQCCSCPAKFDTAPSNSPNATVNHNSRDTTRKTTPFLFQSCTDSDEPHGYETSDLKNLYLSKQSLESRMVTPVLTQEQLLRKGYSNHN